MGGWYSSPSSFPSRSWSTAPALGKAFAEQLADLTLRSRIPTIVDHGNGDFTLSESKAILLYLAETCE